MLFRVVSPALGRDDCSSAKDVLALYDMSNTIYYKAQQCTAKRENVYIVIGKWLTLQDYDCNYDYEPLMRSFEYIQIHWLQPWFCLIAGKGPNRNWQQGMFLFLFTGISFCIVYSVIAQTINVWLATVLEYNLPENPTSSHIQCWQHTTPGPFQ